MAQTLDLERINGDLEEQPALEIIRWAYQTFGDKLSMLSSMQKTASTLTHMLHVLGLHDVEIQFIDTGYHFPETLQLRDRLIVLYGVNIKTYAPEQSPEEQLR